MSALFSDSNHGHEAELNVEHHQNCSLFDGGKLIQLVSLIKIYKSVF